VTRERLDGERRALLAVLDARDIPLDDVQRLRIDGEQSAEQLAQWLRRAAVATTAAEVLDS